MEVVGWRFGPAQAVEAVGASVAQEDRCQAELVQGALQHDETDRCMRWCERKRRVNVRHVRRHFPVVKGFAVVQAPWRRVSPQEEYLDDNVTWTCIRGSDVCSIRSGEGPQARTCRAVVSADQMQLMMRTAAGCRVVSRSLHYLTERGSCLPCTKSSQMDVWYYEDERPCNKPRTYYTLRREEEDVPRDSASTWRLSGWVLGMRR